MTRSSQVNSESDQRRRAPADLIPLTGASPRAALAAARAVLAARPGPLEASVAHQAAAIVLRDFGDVGAAIRELRLAARLARAAGDPGRESDVLTSLGTALVMAGRTAAGLATLDQARSMATGRTELGRILVRHGGSLWIAGRYAEAASDLRRAITLTCRAHDTLWEARARTAAALVDLAVGAVDRAEAGLAAAERASAGTGQHLEIAYARHNRALVAFASGDLPGALRHLDDADARYAELGVFVPDAALDRCAVLLAAGLPADALAEVERALAGRLTATKRAELTLAAARIALAVGQQDLATERAMAARAMFTRQHREWWRTHATLVLIQARLGAGYPPSRLLRPARLTAARLGELGSDETPAAWLAAGRIALALGREAEADRLLAAAARAARRRVPAFARASGALAQALRAAAAGDRRRLLTACERGFGLLEEHLGTLGGAELRAHATAQGTELAQRAALASGRPWLLLRWSERWRAVTLLPPPRPPADPGLRAELAALRDVTIRLEKAPPGTVLHRERLRLETAIRARALRRGAVPGPAAADLDPGALLAALGDRTLGGRTLVELIVVDGDVHVLVCGGGAIRHRVAGRADEAGWEVDFARFGLNRFARGGLFAHGGLAEPPAQALAEPPARALAALAEGGRRLDALLLGAARDELGDGPVIVVPPGRLGAVPWSLLPSLRDRTVTVAPSARAWLRASQAAPFGIDSTVLVSGPGLAAASTEVATLAQLHSGATVLGGGTATTAAVLAAIDGAGLAHIAAHGVFRADSPMFSSLRLDDGPMTVHDLERLRRAPFRLILPSCESGRTAPAGADELLGLASALLPLGTASIAASVAQVNDAAVTPLMVALHGRLRAGPPGPDALAAALRGARDDVRQATADDPVAVAAGWSFIALGA